jgi:protein subunit release factor B
MDYMDNLKKETEVKFSRSSGPGGQNVNKRDTAVRLRHIPTGITVRVQRERSQAENLRIAFERLEKKLEDLNKPETIRISTKVPRSERKIRLLGKRRHSEIKKSRERPSAADDF